MIRQQQDQIQAIQAAQATPSSSYTAVDVSTPTSERSLCLHSHPISIPLPPQQQQQPQQQSHPQQQRTRSPFAITRQASYRSHGSSRAASPALGTPASSATGTEAEWPSPAGPVRDESAFYSAETASLARENLMLKLRIRDLGESPSSPCLLPPDLYV